MTMHTSSRTVRSCLAVLNTLVCVLVSLNARAQSTSGEEQYVGVVTAEDVYVRSGPAESYYPFTKLASGDMVQVMGEKILDANTRWARVATTGPAFAKAYGYIKYGKDETGRLRIGPDGKNAVTLGRTEIVAPNLLSSGLAKDSWKPLVRLEADQSITILETLTTGSEIIHKVSLPAGAQGWVSLSFLRKANATEAAQFKASLTAAASTDSQTAGKTTSSGTPVAAAPETRTPTATNSNASGQARLAANTAASPMPVTDMSTPAHDTDAAAAKPDLADQGETSQPTDAQPAEHAGNTTATTQPEAPKPHLPTLDELEGAFKLLQKEPLETAEVIPLREMYLDLGRRNPDDRRIIRYVTGRADQLQIWADGQKKLNEIAELQARLKNSAEQTDAVRKTIESSEQYTAVGRIAASTIYDGKSLPKLLRLQDGASGRTVAYLQPDEKYELVNLIGNLVGIVGDKTYDGSLRLNIIQPRRIDVLTTDKATGSPAQITNAELPKQ
jgi:uncharacterized protein YgiM (DUF1202 family)